MTAPLVPADVDLRDFTFMPLDIIRLFGSRFHAIATDAEWRAGVTLWAKSFHQVPAASLPDDDIELCRLAELGRDMKTWRKVREVAMHGWIKCSDGRFYHPVVAEKADEAWRRKQAQRARSAKGNAARWGTRNRDGHESESSEDGAAACQTDPQGMPQGSLTDSLKDPKGQGQGQGQGQSSVPAERTAAAVVEPVDLIFGNGLPLLIANGVPERNARTMLGLMRKQHGDVAVVKALERCAAEKPTEPVSWLQAALKSVSPSRRRAGVDEFVGDGHATA